MTATAAMVAELRRMIDEPDDSNGYDDDLLSDIIERYPLLDERGEIPYTYDVSTSPPTPDANEDWIATYDLHAAAADVWQEKAGGVADEFTFGADGGQYSRSDKHEHAMQQARLHLARRAAKSRRAFVWPRGRAYQPMIANLPEAD